MSILIFTIGFIIFVTYMYFLVKMINTQHKIQEKVHGKSSSVRKRYVVKGAGKFEQKEKVTK
jgi:hypothetical protein